MTFDYSDYEMQVVKGIASCLENELSDFITDIKIEKIVSPKEYNFRNDSADVIITLSEDNIKAIETYLVEHSTEFAAYLKARYTSCSGFISSYPNNIEDFMSDNPLEHEHKLGAILNFIALNEGVTEDRFDFEHYLSCSNYSELVPE